MLKNLRAYYIIRRSGLFDAKYYLQNYPDIRRADVDPLMHFVKYGWKEGRNPAVIFITQFYLELYPDVRESKQNPFKHYIELGKSEGRICLPMGNEGIEQNENYEGKKEKIKSKIYLYSLIIRKIFQIVLEIYQRIPVSIITRQRIRLIIEKYAPSIIGVYQQITNKKNIYHIRSNQRSIYSKLLEEQGNILLSQIIAPPWSIKKQESINPNKINNVKYFNKIEVSGLIVSVIIFVNDTPAHFLSNLINSLKNQTYQYWELNIWILDDGNWNEEVLSMYFEKSEIRIHVYTNLGRSNNHELISQSVINAHGKYIIFLNNYDELLPDALDFYVNEISSGKTDLLYSQLDNLTDIRLSAFDPTIDINKYLEVPFIQLIIWRKDRVINFLQNNYLNMGKDFFTIFRELLSGQEKIIKIKKPCYLFRPIPGRKVLAIKENIDKTDFLGGSIPIKVIVDARLINRNTTGTERYILELLKALSSLREENNIQIKAITLAKPNERIDGVEFVTSDHFSAIQESHVFHKTFPASDGMTLAEMALAPSVVFTPLDLISFSNPDYFLNEIDYLNYKNILEIAAKLADMIIGISEHGKTEIVSRLGIPEKNVMAVYLGVRPELFPKESQEGAAFLSQYKLPKDYFLYVGTDYPHKNLIKLLQAFKLIAQELPYSHLVIVGTSYYIRPQPEFIDLKDQLGEKVIHLGHVPDKNLPALYHNARALVYPSLYEGFGLPLLEAMLCRIPVIASDATSIPEVTGRESAILVDAQDEKQIAEAMKCVWENPILVSKLVEAGSKNVTRFNWESTARKTINVYKKAIQNTINTQSQKRTREKNEVLNSHIRSRPSVLIVTHIRCFPPTAGNEQRLFKLVKYLNKLGYRIVMLVNPFEERGELDRESRNYIHQYVDYYEELGDRFDSGRIQNQKEIILEVEQTLKKWNNIEKNFCPDELMYIAEELIDKFSPKIILAEYIWTSRIFALAKPETLRVIDLIDLFSQKNDQVNKYGINDGLAISQTEEISFLNRSDVAIAIQESEADKLVHMSPDCKIITAGIDFSSDSIPDSNSCDERTILIVGSGNPINVKCINEFLNIAWPMILKSEPNCQLRIAGKVCNSIKRSYPNLELLNIVKDLDKEYEKATVVINPVYAGTGLKIKSVEGLAHGKALITWSEGIAGINTDQQPPFMVINSWEQLAEGVVVLIRNTEIRKSLEKAAFAYSDSELSDINVYRQIANVFDNFSKRQLKVLCLYLRYGPNDYPEGLSVLTDWYDKKMSNIVSTIWIIDNKISTEYDGTDLLTGNRLLSGDNKQREFSGFQKIINQHRKEIESYDVVHFVTSAFDKLYTDYREYFSYDLLYPVLHRPICLGHIDSYDEPVSIYNEISQEWIRTCFFFMSPETIYRSANFVNIINESDFFDKDGKFLKNGTLSDRYIRNITDWLHGKEIQGVKWHNKIVSTNDFMSKSIAILNEHMFSIKLKNHGVQLVDFYWLKENLKDLSL